MFPWINHWEQWLTCAVAVLDPVMSTVRVTGSGGTKSVRELKRENMVKNIYESIIKFVWRRVGHSYCFSSPGNDLLSETWSLNWPKLFLDSLDLREDRPLSVGAVWAPVLSVAPWWVRVPDTDRVTLSSEMRYFVTLTVSKENREVCFLYCSH